MISENEKAMIKDKVVRGKGNKTIRAFVSGGRGQKWGLIATCMIEDLSKYVALAPDKSMELPPCLHFWSFSSYTPNTKTQKCKRI